MISVSDETALETHESTEDGLKLAGTSCTVSPPKLKATLTFGWAFLIEETWEGLRLSESQKMLNFPLVGEGLPEVS